MRYRWLIAGGAALALLLAGLLAYAMVVPHWAASAISETARQQLGRNFEAGRAHLDFSPLAIRVDNPKLSAGDDSGDSFVAAKALVIPVRFGQLMSRKFDYAAFTLEDAEIALLIDERGQASWEGAGAAATGPARITLARASVRYFDIRNGQSLAIGAVNGLLDLRADGGLAFKGTGVIQSRLVRIDGDLKSLARVNAEGSPFDLVLDSDIGAVSFSGRLATESALSLAGSLSLSGHVSADLLRLAGLAGAAKFEGRVPFAVDAALDSAGRAYALRKAVLTLGQFRAAGDMTADLRGERPRLQASLTSEVLPLDALVPASGAAPGEWGRQPIAFDMLSGLDAEIALMARDLTYRGINATGAQLALSLKDGNLSTTGVAQPAGGGTLQFAFDAATVSLPPRLSLSLKAENVSAQPLLAGLAGIRGVTGTVRFSADLGAEGQTQEEMIGTLGGSVQFAVVRGAIANGDLGGLLAGARERVLDGWPPATAATVFTILSGELAIADGEADIKTANMVTPEMDVSATGAVDLLRRALDVSIVAFRGQEPVLPVALVIRGLWDRPRIYPDVQDILKDPAAGLARLRQLSPAPGD